MRRGGGEKEEEEEEEEKEAGEEEEKERETNFLFENDNLIFTKAAAKRFDVLLINAKLKERKVGLGRIQNQFQVNSSNSAKRVTGVVITYKSRITSFCWNNTNNRPFPRQLRVGENSRAIIEELGVYNNTLHFTEFAN